MARDRTKQLTAHRLEMSRKKQELHLTTNLRNEVEIGANGTQKYVTQEGINTGTVIGTSWQFSDKVKE